ncbi:UNKNOWN [Stylonychia lemnae]|uniref:NmrA-like domain-containing protein n=1 Tax=Stylonychia lemnae TaxID=5949 RepID=A0A078ADG3_STYLE|nr:UNKNOWN [Stylonychia lemnae]|eukprot:CDW80290.1 UNKNOWN [Stylonychia lemnae]
MDQNLKNDIFGTIPNQKRIVFLGATKNFFKIGYYTIHYLSQNYPEIKLRLAVPNIEDARPSCEGANVELVQWDPNNSETLNEAFKECTASLLVPPINNRVSVSKKYIDMAVKHKLNFLINSGVQFTNQDIQIGEESNQVIAMLDNCGIKYCNLNLPMFLENLLYQVDDVFEKGIFGFPCNKNSSFSYVSCKDLGKIIADIFVQEKVYDNTFWTAPAQVSIVQIEQTFTKMMGKQIQFVQVSDQDFIDSLLRDTGSASSIEAANQILDIWKIIERGEDVQANNNLKILLGKEPQTASEWVFEHRCCFNKERSCMHPQPPKKIKIQSPTQNQELQVINIDEANNTFDKQNNLQIPTSDMKRLSNFRYRL